MHVAIFDIPNFSGLYHLGMLMKTNSSIVVCEPILPTAFQRLEESSHAK